MQRQRALNDTYPIDLNDFKSIFKEIPENSPFKEEALFYRVLSAQGQNMLNIKGLQANNLNRCTYRKILRNQAGTKNIDSELYIADEIVRET